MLWDVSGYLSTVVGKALVLALFVNGVLGLVARAWRPIEIPRKAVFWLSIAALYFAGFQAWREERERAEKVVPPTPSVAVTRHLTTAQRAALPNARSVGMVAGCELTLSFTHTSETEQYAREVGAALQEAGWPLLSSPFLNWADKATDVNHPVAVVGHPADPAAEALVMALKKAGVEIPWRRDANRQTCHIELQIDDVGPR